MDERISQPLSRVIGDETVSADVGHDELASALDMLRQWSVAADGRTPAQLWAMMQGRPWQCSGCLYVERAHTCSKACPSCKRVGYMCGSVSREAIRVHDETGFANACRVVAHAERMPKG